MENKVKEKIVLLEDKANIREKKINAIKNAIVEVGLTEQVEPIAYTGRYLKDIFSKKGTEDIEEILALHLKSESIKLVVVDRDLTDFDSEIRSESTVTKAGNMAAIPVCGYSRRTVKNFGGKIGKLKENTQTNLITIEKESDEFAKKVVEIYLGFKTIEDSLEIFEMNYNEISSAKLLGKILKKEKQSSYFETYHNNITVSASSFSDELTQQNYSKFSIGLWLYKYILPFPGVILHEQALAAYLNITESDLSKHLEVFDKAKYVGPFSHYTKYWWRYEIDDLLTGQDCDNGAEYVNKMLDVQITKHDLHDDKTYFCVVTKKPISLNSSVSTRSIIPLGADLSRINKEEAGKWMSLL